MISIVTPCYNEEANVQLLYEAVKGVMATLPGYRYEHIFIDNASQDTTVKILRGIAAADKNIKVIVNARNFGHIRSPFYGLLQSTGDATILLVADFQDPPGMISDFIKKWEEGFKVVLGVKTTSQESAVMFAIRSFYYSLLSRLSEVEVTKNNTGFGLYDRKIIEILKQIDDPYPYFRGLVRDIGFESAKITYDQPQRKRGITKNNFYTLYDLAILGIINQSKVPLRLATWSGFFLSILFLLIGFGYFIAKLVFWNKFVVGSAPVLIGLFLFSSFQLFFVGLLGEYIGAIHTQILKRPLVIEKERIGFE
jgi:glycosyltransferase involved in cell wall biosynthesis